MIDYAPFIRLAKVATIQEYILFWTETRIVKDNRLPTCIRYVSMSNISILCLPSSFAKVASVDYNAPYDRYHIISYHTHR